MDGTLDDLYLNWLYSRIDKVRVRKSSKTYWRLFRQLYSTEFVWFVANDDNRAEDGRELRNEWANDLDFIPNEDWMHLPCSFLELLVGLACRLTFEADRNPAFWFWHLLTNLNLSGYHDLSRYNEEEVEDVVHTVIWRTYDFDGRGGLFPLTNPCEDQRKIEIWYQMSAYILQNQ
jgi:hypothetical protein